MTGRVLVAGLGNVFLSDDGFGVEVARRLAERLRAGPLPPNVQVVDVGIRGVHLAFDLLDGADLLILADVAELGERPGTVSVIEVEPGAPAVPGSSAELMDAHDMGPDAVLALLRKLGGRVDRAIVVACEPASLDPGIGLSAPVAAAVGTAVSAIGRLVRNGQTAASSDEKEETRAEQGDQGRRAGTAGGGDRAVGSGHQALSGTP